MAESSRFWITNGTGDGPGSGYTQQQFYDFMRKTFLTDQEASEGVLKGTGNGLAVTGSSSPLAVDTGAAMVYGLFYENTASVNLTVTTPSVGTTGGHVILRAGWAAQTVRLVAVRNTDGTAAIPALTQSAGTTWEIRLASFTISTGGVITLTDARSYCHFGTSVNLAMLDSDIVIPQFYRRQGGHATDWSATVVTTYTPASVRFQAGAVLYSGTAASEGTVTVTFPAAFGYAPIILATAWHSDGDTGIAVGPYGILSDGSGCSFWWQTVDGSTKTNVRINWLAIGPGA